MSVVEALPARLKYLLRFAHALTGLQVIGDGYALAALEAASAGPAGMNEVPDPGILPYHLLLGPEAAA